MAPPLWFAIHSFPQPLSPSPRACESSQDLRLQSNTHLPKPSACGLPRLLGEGREAGPLGGGVPRSAPRSDADSLRTAGEGGAQDRLQLAGFLRAMSSLPGARRQTGGGREGAAQACCLGHLWLVVRKGWGITHGQEYSSGFQGDPTVSPQYLTFFRTW